MRVDEIRFEFVYVVGVRFIYCMFGVVVFDDVVCVF